MTSQTQDLVITNTSSIPESNVISFGFIKNEDVRVEVGTTVSNRTLRSYPSDWTMTSDNRVQLASSVFSATGTYKLKIYRQTNTSTLAHTFQVGSSIKAEDLNNSNKQAIFAAEENTNSINSLATGDASGSIQIDGSNIADNSINSNKIINLQVKTEDLDNDSVTTDKLSNSINSAITANTAKVTNATHTGDVTGSTALTIADGAVTQAKINSAVIFTPVGTVIWFAGTTAPTGYLKCNGDAIPNGSGTVQSVTADFSALYAIVSANVPDLRGEFVRGWDDGKGTDTGRSIRSTQTELIKSHRHWISRAGIDDANLSGTDGSPSQEYGLFADSGGNNLNDDNSYPLGRFTRLDPQTQDNGNGSLHAETRPRNVALLMCIKY